AGDGEHRGMDVADGLVAHAEAARDDHPAVLVERFADRVERLFDRGVDEAAGVHDDEVGVAVARRGGIAFGAQLREDALRVDERLGTAERDETDFRTALTTYRGRCFCFGYQRGNRGRTGRRTCCAPGSASGPGTARTSSGSAPCRPASGSASPAPGGS